MGSTARLLAAVLAFSTLISGEPAAKPHIFRWKDFTLRPYGFLEYDFYARSKTEGDSIITRYGKIPLDTDSPQYFASPRLSRLSLKTELPVGQLKLSTYTESDFLDVAPGRNAYQWRQYYASARYGNWEILGGQAWSLMRPNRVGTSPESGMFHTDVNDGGYHNALLGARHRQVRLARHFGDNEHVVFSWEADGNFAGKFVRDGKTYHAEILAMQGHYGRRGAGLAGSFTIAPRFRFVMQQFVTRRALTEAMGVCSLTASGFSSLDGLEFQWTPKLELYAYSGWVKATSGTGNQLISEYTTGAVRRLPAPRNYGLMTLAAQYSHASRNTFTNQSGAMDFFILRWKYALN